MFPTLRETLINSLFSNKFDAEQFDGESNNSIFSRYSAMLRAFLQSRRTAGFSDRKTPAGQHQIGEREQREQLCGVLG